MQACRVNITTIVDGNETSITRDGMVSLVLPITLEYTDGDAKTSIVLDKNTATIKREGEYSLQLFLQENENTIGCLSIAGSKGDVPIYTTRVGYSLQENSLLLRLEYALIFGQEKQNMRLRISAKVK